MFQTLHIFMEDLGSACFLGNKSHNRDGMCIQQATPPPPPAVSFPPLLDKTFREHTKEAYRIYVARFLGLATSDKDWSESYSLAQGIQLRHLWAEKAQHMESISSLSYTH